MRVITAMVCGVIRAAPSPWTTRAATRVPMLSAKPHQAEAAVNTTRPIMYIRFGPKRSPSRPVISSGTAYASR